MKSLILVFLFFCFLVFLSISANYSYADDTDHNLAGAFSPKETIKFGVYTNGLRVGSGKISYFGVVDLDSKKAQKIILEVSTFSLNDKETVFATIDFTKPVKVERYVRFMGKTEVIEENYDENAKNLVISKKVNKKELTKTDLSTQESFSNVISLLYLLRGDKDISKGKVYKVTLPTNKLDFVVKETNKKIKVALGQFEAYYIESVPPKFKIWLTNDNKRLPIRIQGLIPAARVYLAATEVSY